MTEPEPTGAPEQPQTRPSTPSLVIAGIWAFLGVAFAIGLLVNAQDIAYGGDAYTGIQNAVMLAVRGIAFLLFGSSALGLIVALRR